MLQYKILTKLEEKMLIKEAFFGFFSSVYERELTDVLWNHQIINSPYNDSPLFLAIEDGKIVGSALMILQKCMIDECEYRYYLFTTSAILKEYRPKGVYAQLLRMQKEYSENNNVDFIFAFPNKIAYPVLKLFGGFKDLKKDSLVKTILDNLMLENIDNSLIFDSQMFEWRFEHKDYKFHIMQDKVVIFKEFEENYDLLAVYSSEEFNFNFIDSPLMNDEKILTLKTYVKDDNVQVVDSINATYFPINKNIDYTKFNINLLMSDVF